MRELLTKETLRDAQTIVRGATIYTRTARGEDFSNGSRKVKESDVGDGWEGIEFFPPNKLTEAIGDATVVSVRNKDGNTIVIHKLANGTWNTGDVAYEDSLGYALSEIEREGWLDVRTIVRYYER